MNTPIERLISTFTIAGILFMAPFIAMARMAIPASSHHRAPIVQKRVTSLPAGEAETTETNH